jgi:hypothetical protein
MFGRYRDEARYAIDRLRHGRETAGLDYLETLNENRKVENKLDQQLGANYQHHATC